MNRNEFLKTITLGAACFSLSKDDLAAADNGARPNIIFILTDDLGRTDLGCYGSPNIKTPHLDRMAREGMRFTDYYCPAGVCTPTRAALMTGCYPKRVSLHVAVLPPQGRTGLNTREVTIAGLLKGSGYATGCIGKWHLGTETAFFPTRHGFDSYFGMPGPNHGASDLYRDEERIALNKEVSYDTLTQRYTEEAVQFIANNKDRPFFLYLAHNAPHIPLFAGAAYRGKSARGLYGDMIEEIDGSCGAVLAALKEHDLDRNTLVIFTSDNGPANQAAPPLHGGKGSSWEAGFRVPCIARWPGQIPAGRICNKLVTTMDFLPTLAALGGAPLPANNRIDGHNIASLLRGRRGGHTPYKAFYYYGRDGKMYAVREGKWKLHLLAPSEQWFGKLPKEALLATKPATPPPWLYDLQADIGETNNLAGKYPKLVSRLRTQAEAFDRQLEAEKRPAGVI